MIAFAELRERLAPRQLAVLEYLYDYWAEHSYPPSLREIGRHFGIRSTNGVSDHLLALERKGFVTHVPLQSRSVVLTGDGFEAIEGPWLDGPQHLNNP